MLTLTIFIINIDWFRHILLINAASCRKLYYENYTKILHLFDNFVHHGRINRDYFLLAP